MTEDDLKHLQDGFFEEAKKNLLEHGRLRPTGFVIAPREQAAKLLERGWGGECFDPKIVNTRGAHGEIAVLALDLWMDAKRLYHAVLSVFPQAHEVLPGMVTLGEALKVDDPYRRVLRPFLQVAQLTEKDVLAASLRQACEETSAFACIMQTEAWLRAVAPYEDEDVAVSADLSQDAQSVEVLLSTMETYGLARVLTLPILREAKKPRKKRDEGAIRGFGELTEGLDTPDNTNVLEGRLVRFLKPLESLS